MGKHSADRRLLLYAGHLGHQYVGINGKETDRRVVCECNDITSAARILCESRNGGMRRIWRKNGNRWTLCYDKGPINA